MNVDRIVSCQTQPPAPNLGWEISKFLFMVYDKVQPGSALITTSHISFDIQGGFTNRTFHCETTSFASGNITKSENIWFNCTTNSTTEYTYTTSIQYKPEEWNALTIRELMPCKSENLTAM